MIARIALVVMFVATGTIVLNIPRSVGAQEAATTCASALWLDPLSATPEPEGSAQPADTAPSWMSTELTDACSSQTFALGDFAGKTIYVESMATWCGECYEQLSRVKETFAQIPEAEREDIVLVALSSEIDIPREDLAAYAEKTEFPLIFAVMPEEMLKTMVAEIGREWAIPSAMPHVVVAPDGTVGELSTGGASPEELLAEFAAAKKQSAP